MFNLQGSELVIILLLALVVLGPEKLPEAMRKAGQFYAELKKMSSGFQDEFKAAIDEPMNEMRDTANLLRDSADFRKFEAGERPEKPKSAEMVEAADPDAVPVADVPTFEPAANPDPVDTDDALGAASDPDQTDDPLPPEPFSNTQLFSAAPPAPPERLEPFSGAQQSSAAPRAGAPDDEARDDEARDDEARDEADCLEAPPASGTDVDDERADEEPPA